MIGNNEKKKLCKNSNENKTLKNTGIKQLKDSRYNDKQHN